MEMSHPFDAPEASQALVPVTILTGFLGAGKTTLLNRILTETHGRRIAVLVNDFGDINIDSELVVDVEDNTISLANGCVCCEVRNDLMEAVDEIIAMPDQPEHIVLEASGVADPGSIAMTFVQPHLRDRIHLDSIISVVDAAAVFDHPEYPELQDIKIRQVAFSDMVILNKVDLVDETGLQKARDWIDGRLKRVRRIETSNCEVPLEVLLGVGRFSDAQLDGADHHHHHPRASFATGSLVSDAVFDESAVKEMIRRRLPANIYRLKGFVNLEDGPAVLQAVGRRATITYDDTLDKQTRLVAIGAPGSINPTDLEALLSTCKT